MKKLVIKTTIITLASVIGLLALLYGIFALFIPRPLANFFDKIGMHNSSVHYYEKAYNKSKSIDDLYTLCLKLDSQKDSEEIEKYSKILIQDDGFVAFGKSKDTDTNGITTEEYIEGKFVRAAYKNNGVNEAIVAIVLCLDNGECYPDYNPFLMLITDETIDWSKNKVDLELIKACLDEVYFPNSSPDGLEYQLTDEEKAFVERDMVLINQMLA